MHSASDGGRPSHSGPRREARHEHPRRWRAWGVGLALVATGAIWAAARFVSADRAFECARCNVLLVTIDTLRVDRVGAYGSARGLTPALDALASRGWRFARAYSPAPLTLPAHASILTGATPARHGVHDNGLFRLDERMPTLATVLHDHGYATAAFVGAFVLDARFGLTSGFDTYDDRYPTHPTDGRSEASERRASDVAALTSAWIASRTSAQPWMAWMHFYDPHAPYDPPEPFGRAKEPYDGEIAYADAVLATVLDRLPRSSPTIVVVAADHGESLGEHGEETHGVFAYDATLRVPLIVARAGTTGTSRPRIVDSLVGLVDVAPSILDMVGLVAPATMEGRSVRRLVSGRSDEERPVFFEALHATITRGWAPLTGVVATGLKLIDLPVPEAYDLASDPNELHNVYDTRPADVARLQARLAEARAAADGAGGGPSSRVVPTREAVERLRSLGYTAVDAGPHAPPSVGDDPKTLVVWASRLEQALQVFDDSWAASRAAEASAAVGAAAQLVAERPADAYGVGVLASMYRRMGRLDAAITTLDTPAGATRDPSLVVQLASDLLAAGRVDEAIARLEGVCDERPTYVDAVLQLGIAYGRAGRTPEARARLESAIALDPTAAEAHVALGVLALAGADLADAEARFRQAVSLDGRLTTARAGLAVVCARTGRRQEALDLWEAVLRDRPDDAETLFNLGVALVESGRVDEGRRRLREFLEVAPPGSLELARERARRLLARAPGS
ncbi:MAG: sulfatase-like hydrolase/transferase [Vicinamibacterales bacterium]